MLANKEKVKGIISKLDKDYIRIPTKNKRPLVSNWTNPAFYYKEPKSIGQLLRENQEYGLRTGKIIHSGYYFCAIIWKEKSNLFYNLSYTETENSYHYYLLIKELPPNCSLSNNKAIEPLGSLFSNGKLVVGSQSVVNGYTYNLVKKSSDFYTCDTVQNLKDYLDQRGIYLSVYGRTEPLKVSPVVYPKAEPRLVKKNTIQIKKTFIKESIVIKEKSFPYRDNKVRREIKIWREQQDLLGNNWRRRKFRKCGRCKETYSTIHTRREHRAKYCSKTRRYE